jgi:hypothetical protein
MGRHQRLGHIRIEISVRVYSVDFDVSHMVLLALIHFKEHID